VEQGDQPPAPDLLPLLEGVRVEGSLITYKLPAHLESVHASGVLWVRYPPEVDLQALPEEIRLLPAAYFFAPLAWAFDRHYSLAVLEERAIGAFEAIRGYFSRVYPGLAWSGSISGTRISRAAASDRNAFDAAALFTAGVDSTYTMLSRGAQRLLLVNVWESRTGSDRPNSSYMGWLAEAGAVVRPLGHELASVQTNAWQVIDRERIARELSARQRIFNWWSDVHFGMTLAGLASPLLHHHGISQLYIAGGSAAERTEAAGLSRGDQVPEYAAAASPHVDNSIVLGATRVEHDASATRQQKLEVIVSDSRLKAAGPFSLRVCLLAPYDAAENCGSCEKCLRTISEIITAGGDPRRLGFPDYGPRTLAAIRRRFEQKKMPLNPARAIIWQGSQSAARTQVEHAGDGATREYLEWLAGFDFEAYARHHSRRRPIGLLRRLGRLPVVPSLYLRLRVAIARLRARYGR
jgi:hypothetical protein